MSTRRSHGSARTELARSAELAVTAETPDRSQGRDASGRFAARHGLSFTKSWHLRMAEQLGVELEGEAGKLAREAYRSYRLWLRELPATSPGITSLVAARARAATLAAFFARRAMTLGLGASEEADAAMRLSVLLDQRAERLAISSWDLSTRAAKAAPRPIDAHGEVARAFGGDGT